jgi:hypothetical protein
MRAQRRPGETRAQRAVDRAHADAVVLLILRLLILRSVPGRSPMGFRSLSWMNRATEPAACSGLRYASSKRIGRALHDG